MAGPRAYLTAAGVMARLGTALGWRHYSAGWHATCTAGAPASAAGAAVALGLPAEKIAIAMALAVPAAGGVQRAFGTDAKSLQVGFAVDAGIRAARLAAAGADADPAALDAWLELVGGDPAAVDATGPAIPDGLAVKIYPCCYALQRPISALAELGEQGLAEAEIRRIVLRTPEATVVPLIHHRPDSGLQGKFSLEYAAATALLDAYPGFASFTDTAVRRDAARRLVSLVEVKLDPGGSWLLDGQLDVEIHTSSGTILRTSQQFPPGSPARPPSRRPAPVQAGRLRTRAGHRPGFVDLAERSGHAPAVPARSFPGTRGAAVTSSGPAPARRSSGVRQRGQRSLSGLIAGGDRACRVCAPGRPGPRIQRGRHAEPGEGEDVESGCDAAAAVGADF